MLDILVYGMVYLGAALMAYNVYCYVKFTRFVKGREAKFEGFNEKNGILYVPTTLIVLFFVGYLVVGLFGNPDIVVGAILFGGSIFVFVMYKLMDNITKRVIRGEQFEAQFKAAEASNQAKADFLASISHEMRTPMNVILGLDGMALKDPDLSPNTRSQLERIGQNARYLLDLVNNVLDINRVESGDMAVLSEEFCLRDMWEQLNAIAGTQCENKGLSFQTSISDNASGWYVGDETMIKQVALHILDNAVKYTDAPGTVEFSVDAVPCGEGDHTITLTVKDTGVGISPEYLDTVFEVFTQEDASMTSRFGGSGLGLAAANQKTKLMGGSIAVESEKDKGSTFVVSLPLPPCERPAASEGPVDDAADEGILEGKLVLIVEDVDDNAEIVADLLELEGVESERAENGQVALEMFQNSPAWHYDAVLMDLRMPVMDGLEATRRIRALDREDAKAVPILALTANAFDSDVKQSLDAGMDVHLAKPTDADLLYSSLKQLIRQSPAKGGAA